VNVITLFSWNHALTLCAVCIEALSYIKIYPGSSFENTGATSASIDSRTGVEAVDVIRGDGIDVVDSLVIVIPGDDEVDVIRAPVIIIDSDDEVLVTTRRMPVVPRMPGRSRKC
jgi:hypothetical protein